MYQGPIHVHRFMYLISSKLEQGPTLPGRRSTMPILQIRKPSFTEIQSLAQGHTASKADEFRSKLSSARFPSPGSFNAAVLPPLWANSKDSCSRFSNTYGSAFFLSSGPTPLMSPGECPTSPLPAHTQYIYNPALRSPHETRLSF